MTDFNTDEFVQSLIGKSPFEIYKAVHKLDKEMGKGYASSVLQQSDEFGQYCARQMKAFLENRVALTQRDADHVDSWWKFSLIDLSSKEIDTVKNKGTEALAARSDRFTAADFQPSSDGLAVFKEKCTSSTSVSCVTYSPYSSRYAQSSPRYLLLASFALIVFKKSISFIP